MSGHVPNPASPSVERTFRSYSQEQGMTYAKHRLSYHESLYKMVMDYHISSGGRLDTVLDVGCGPGTAVSDLAPHFTHAVGIDPSDGMIHTARSLGGVSANSEAIRYAVSAAEALGSDLSSPIPDGSVDLIIAASSAHWFDMSKFWQRAAQLLAPGGTVAVWGGGGLRVDPTMLNHAAIQAAIDDLSLSVTDYMEPGNRKARNLYTDLELPWSMANPVPEFDETTFQRKEWNTGDQYGPEEHFYANTKPVDVETLEQMIGTDSPVTRWRQAHPEAAGTENDVVRIMRRRIERTLRDAGVERGEEMLKGGVQGVLLMVKKKTCV